MYRASAVCMGFSFFLGVPFLPSVEQALDMDDPRLAFGLVAMVSILALANVPSQMAFRLTCRTGPDSPLVRLGAGTRSSSQSHLGTGADLRGQDERARRQQGDDLWLVPEPPQDRDVLLHHHRQRVALADAQPAPGARVKASAL